MDIASRFPRAPTYMSRDVNAMTEDSGGESETNPVRRKFQRTATDPDSSTDTTFRKPSMPASATRAAAGLEHRPSFSQRRRSTLRENVRVPSGPRDYPSPEKRRLGSTSSITPSVAESTNTIRSFQPPSNADAYFYNSRLASSNTRLRFGIDADEEANLVPNGDRRQDAYGFLPDVNFDEFQNSINNYDGSNLLNEFPSVNGGRVLPKEDEYSMARNNGLPSTGRTGGQQQPQTQELGRTQSLRQRLAGGRLASSGQQASTKDRVASSDSTTSSLRNRRQSSVPQAGAASGPTPAGATAKPPRKSVGPGLLAGITRSDKTTPTEPVLKSALARNNSLSKARRTTIQPANAAGAELPRASTLTATTQSRQSKVKSLQPPPRDQQDANSTTPSKLSSKNNQNRAHTPSSSGNRRQSLASGRASGLGARTISPTDARRLKRLSMMNVPPLPPTTVQPTPPEEMPNPFNNINSCVPELPRLAQPSPSLIPRKTSNATLSSARASPESRQDGGVSLRSKSSYSSLISNSANGSTSRLPTPKPKSAMQSSSSMAQYGDQYGEQEQEELVPPVPAIPKAYESPKDLESKMPFFSSSMKPTQSGTSDTLLEPAGLDGSFALPTPWTSQTPRTSFDVPSETPRKRSGDHIRPHRRTNTMTEGTNGSTSVVPPPTAPPPRPAMMQPDPNGRKNANLQPLRLPPLNLMPINTRGLQTGVLASLPRPSDETDMRDDFMNYHTPEPKRMAKTPSTPMTASKATFFRRQEGQNKALRSSSSHYALRDVMGVDSGGNMLTKFWDDSEWEDSGVPIAAKSRNAITPFASGSLPKNSGELARLRGEYVDDSSDYEAKKPQGPRARAQTNASAKSLLGSEMPVEFVDAVETPVQQATDTKKESSEKKESGGLRRKLSLGWRRTSSKAANHAENKTSPQDEKHPSNAISEKDREWSKLQKQQRESYADMPPPKLPASATWTGDVPSLPSSSRPSLDSNGYLRRKSQVPTSASTTNLAAELDSAATAPKTRSQHSEQPTPVNNTAHSARIGSWGNIGNAFRSGLSKHNPQHSSTRHRLTPSNISAVVKDKDDLAADEEMQRLSRKRKDVDSAARETDDLKKRAVARSPWNAGSVLHDRSLSGGSGLNVFERGEVVDYEKDGIYFTGTKSVRKIIGSLTPSPQPSTTTVSSQEKTSGSSGSNFGYDDERGDYNIVLGDHLAYRYEVVDILGKGSFGQVVRCVDHKDGGIVAVKIIRNKKRFHQQALVEVGILGKLREWDPDGSNATLSITTSFYFRSHLCIVTPCLSINLYELIKSHNFVGFALPLIRRFARQLLACLCLLQTKRIIHCDLKPENILLCEARKADVRVIDFGSSCREEEKVYTYIQSRFYRSPEVILGSSYGLGIDMWSLGCILAELWTGYPIFPGENEQEQLACIMEIFGPPDRHLVERCTRKKLFFDSVGKPRVTVSSKGRRRRPSSKTLQQALKTEDEAFVDFIARCLRWDPDRRLKPSDAIAHPFITNMPFHQRPGIPDEARRAARVRSNAAVPASNGQSIPSPVKRSAGGSGAGNAFSQHQTSTPARERSRALPETPQTAVRNGLPVNNNIMHGSPVKASTASVNANRRHSAITTAGAAAMAGSKRASNGAVLAGGMPPPPRGASGNLAQMAARESMATAGPSVAAMQSSERAGRWR